MDGHSLTDLTPLIEISIVFSLLFRELRVEHLTTFHRMIDVLRRYVKADGFAKGFSTSHIEDELKGITEGKDDFVWRNKIWLRRFYRTYMFEGRAANTIIRILVLNVLLLLLIVITGNSDIGKPWLLFLPTVNYIVWVALIVFTALLWGLLFLKMKWLICLVGAALLLFLALAFFNIPSSAHIRWLFSSPQIEQLIWNISLVTLLLSFCTPALFMLFAWRIEKNFFGTFPVPPFPMDPQSGEGWAKEFFDDVVEQPSPPEGCIPRLLYDMAHRESEDATAAQQYRAPSP